MYIDTYSCMLNCKYLSCNKDNNLVKLLKCTTCNCMTALASLTICV